MKCKIKTAARYYDPKQRKKLSKLGFTFDKSDEKDDVELMNKYESVYINLRTLKDLTDIMDEYGELILGWSNYDELEITIYDDWVE